MPTLLVVDDEPSILLAFRRAFRDTSVEVITAETAGDGVELARRRRPDVLILDIHLPDLTGLEALGRFRELDARSPIIFITGKSTTDTAIEAMKLGAYEYLLKPLELAQLRQVIDRALEISRLMHVPAVVADNEPVDDGADAIIGRCPAMQEVYKAIGRVASQDVTVLISGESGTGKELVARAIYQHSRRAAGPVPGHQLRRHPRAPCWKANCSATKRAHSPAPTAGGSASLSNAPAARFFWTRSATCPH